MPALGARNPLPLARRALVRLPVVEPLPLAVRDAAGARHPAQLVADDQGRALLVELELGALETTTFAPLNEPVAGAWWEVSERVIDNGRVRAEIDDLGRIARLCWDGFFADWNGPAVDCGMPEPPRIAVLERGPVRAVIAVERSTLSVRYQLHAHDDVLRVSLRNRGSEIRLTHPTNATGSVTGMGWVALTDGLGRGVAVLSAQSLVARVDSGCASLVAGAQLDYALATAQRPPRSHGLGQLARDLASAHLTHDGAATPTRFRLVAPQHVVVSSHRAVDGGNEITLAEQAGAKAKVYLYAPPRLAGTKVAADGRTTPLRATPEDDGLLIELAPRETATIRF